MSEPAMTQRPAVVLLHSSAGSARQWEGLAARLRPRFFVSVVEFHGHGAQADWHGQSPLALADDAALVEPVLAQRHAVHVVGHSYGAAVALKLASMHPDAVRSVVAFEPVLFGLLNDDAASLQPAQEVAAVATFLRNCLARGDADSAARRFVDFWSGDGAWDALSARGQQAVAARMHSVLGHFDALANDRDQRAELARLRMPTLLLSGAQTVGVTRRIAGLLRGVLAHAECEVLPRMGHMGPITHAAEVNDRILRFLLADALAGSAAPLRERRVNDWLVAGPGLRPARRAAAPDSVDT